MPRSVHPYRNISEFVASAGALEGFVYHKTDLDPEALTTWVENLVTAYHLLPGEAMKEIQPTIDQTLGRAIRSLTPLLGQDHVIVEKVKSMVKGEMPTSSDNFSKKKWFQE